MAILRFGGLFDGFVNTDPWVTPWFVSGSGGVVGLWMRPYRDAKPGTWDQAGNIHLACQTNPAQLNFRIESRILIFEQYTLFLFPTALVGTPFRLEVDTVEWIPTFSNEYGTVTTL